MFNDNFDGPLIAIKELSRRAAPLKMALRVTNTKQLVYNIYNARKNRV